MLALNSLGILVGTGFFVVGMATFFKRNPPYGAAIPLLLALSGITIVWQFWHQENYGVNY